MIKPCDACTQPAEFGFLLPEDAEVVPRSCARHLGLVAGNVIDTWGDLGPMSIARSGE